MRARLSLFILLAAAPTLAASQQAVAPPYRLAVDTEAYRLAGGEEGAAQRRHDALLVAAAKRHGLDPLLLHALVAVESGYDARARSPKGALGLMQLMPETARRYRVRDLLDPAQNVAGGTAYLRDLLERFEGELPLALAAYNAGEAAVLRHGRRIPPYAETRDYVPRVIALYEQLRREREDASPYRLRSDWRARLEATR